MKASPYTATGEQPRHVDDAVGVADPLVVEEIFERPHQPVLVPVGPLGEPGLGVRAQHLQQDAQGEHDLGHDHHADRRSDEESDRREPFVRHRSSVAAGGDEMPDPSPASVTASGLRPVRR